jgi:hypothetical protein
MSSFFETFIHEALARRRRIATTVGPLAQGIFDLALLAGVVLGSLGLFMRPWMAAAAPWGFGLPVVALAGHFLLEARRQQSERLGLDPDTVKERGDLFAVLFSLACAAIGFATFAYAYSQQPAPPPAPPPQPAEVWTPPENVIDLDISR